MVTAARCVASFTFANPCSTLPVVFAKLACASAAFLDFSAASGSYWYALKAFCICAMPLTTPSTAPPNNAAWSVAFSPWSFMALLASPRFFCVSIAMLALPVLTCPAVLLIMSMMSLLPAIIGSVTGPPANTCVNACCNFGPISGPMAIIAA